MTEEILVVDDEADIRDILAAILQDEGYETRAVADSTAALEAVRTRAPSLILLDIWLEGSPLDGMQILEQVKQEHPNLPIIMISGHGTVEMAVSAIKMGAYDFIENPFQTDRLLVLIERAMETARLRRENEELLARAGGTPELMGSSPVIQQIDQEINRVAPTSSRVLISGPAGAGKEVIARLIHARSTRSNRQLVVLNCAAMHPDRMESELFGVEAGENGRAGKTGTLERANGGTLLLDEVADMPMETQGKIVRVLQDQTFLREGGRRPVQVDIRVIATTNRDIEAEIEAGRFREDLYYRLRVVPIDVPPLQDRRVDIPELARHFLNSAAERAGTQAGQFAPDAVAALQAYHWPGNVRQLSNVMERLLIMRPEGDGGIITAKSLPTEIMGADTLLPRWDKSSEIMGLPLRDAREQFEREYLLTQITRFGGNVSRTAEFIGMERSALHRKMKSLGIQGNEKATSEANA